VLDEAATGAVPRRLYRAGGGALPRWYLHGLFA